MNPREFKVDGQIQLDEDILVPARILRWLESQGMVEGVPKGLYVVEEISNDSLRIALGDWDENGNLTFRSAKHGYLIVGAENIRRFAEGLQGPRDWSPRKK